MAQYKILIVDDDPDISNVVKLYLANDGYDVYTVENGREALEKLSRVKPCLIILDVQMPGLDGLEVCREIRKRSSVPIIFLSCRVQGDDKIVGLNAGADDYIAKPFDPGELLARVNAHLRRQTRLSNSLQGLGAETVTFPGLAINPTTHSVQVNGVEVTLSALEFQLLLLLARKPNVVWAMDDIYQQLWHADSMGDNRTVMVHISNLRRKLGIDPKSPQYIVTVKGVGYKFASPPTDLRDREGIQVE